jgi:hypothetical protein
LLKPFKIKNYLLLEGLEIPFLLRHFGTPDVVEPAAQPDNFSVALFDENLGGMLGSF